MTLEEKCHRTKCQDAIKKGAKPTAKKSDGIWGTRQTLKIPVYLLVFLINVDYEFKGIVGTTTERRDSVNWYFQCTVVSLSVYKEYFKRGGIQNTYLTPDKELNIF